MDKSFDELMHDREIAYARKEFLSFVHNFSDGTACNIEKIHDAEITYRNACDNLILFAKEHPKNITITVQRGACKNLPFCTFASIQE